MGCGTYIVFHGLLGLVYDQQDPDTCLWRHTSYSGPESNSHPSCSHPSIQCCSLVLCRPFLSRLTHQFLPYPQLLSLWFLTSLSPVLHLVSISPSFLPKLTAQPCFLLAFCLALSPFPFLSPYSPYPLSPEGVDWHCDVMMSHQHSSVSVDNCQLGQTQRNLLHFQAPEKAMEVPCGQLPCIGIHYFLFFFKY